MNRKFLEELGLEKEVIDKIMAEHGKTINNTKQELDTLREERDNLKTELGKRDTQLDELSKQVKDNEELTKEINRLKEENQTATQELQQKLEKQAFDFALERALVAAKARNPKAVKALLDLETIKLDGDKLLGFDEQKDKIKESDPYLFWEEKPELKGRKPHPSDPHRAQQLITKEQFQKMGYKERVDLKQNNPDLYNNLIKGD